MDKIVFRQRLEELCNRIYEMSKELTEQELQAEINRQCEKLLDEAFPNSFTKQDFEMVNKVCEEKQIDDLKEYDQLCR